MTDHAQPFFDETGAAVYPAFHVVAGLTRAAGAKLVKAQSSDSQKVECIAYRARGATLVWVANLRRRGSAKSPGARASD